MKRFTYTASLVAAVVTILLASAATGSASSVTAAAAPPFNLTVTAPSFVVLGCCYTYIGIEPTVAALPRIGRATVSGFIEWCGSSIYSPCPDRNGTTLSLLFTSANGDTLTLAGYNPIGDTPLTWSVTGGTGRFAGASGTGIYTSNTEPGADGWVTTLHISGTFSMR